MSQQTNNNDDDDNFNDYEEEQKQRIREQKDIDKILSGTGFCILCGENDPLVLQEHHIAGKKHSKQTATLCADCHTKISRKQQQSYPLEWRPGNTSSLKYLAFTLRGIADILRAISDFILEREHGKAGGGV